ncbi:hypothetical protein HK100_003542 [Physocladia obscura]|uniref:Rhamnogalacturonase A/B/Epimerase-like pectate lyase domain-containing protein n=1 Tax=Physocladia obscura TaxID=109957 RepID=A0AAD5SU15_9FUNG|nr:hypothetical protein HK100_003542 [Physocladia obscura]
MGKIASFYGVLAALLVTLTRADYWLNDITHRGTVPFGSSSYTVFRNVLNYGATGNGVTDDTAAINAAISAGSRCGLGCDSTTVTPAIIYFPPGTYLISSPLLQYYYTQMIGDANSLPILKASSSFSGIALIDADPTSGGVNWFTNQNNFFRQVRNFVIDLTGLALTTGTGIHWQVSQATSLQNIYFKMIVGGTGNAQQGIFMENGSGGFFSNLTFTGGNIGMAIGNQQFTTRNLVFNNINTAILMIWDWGWTFKGLTINNCGVGINMAAGTASAELVGSAILLDSTFNSVTVGISTLFSSSSLPVTAGSLRIDNVNFVNTPVAVSNSGSTVLAGNQLVGAWGQGYVYTAPSTTSRVQGTLPTISKPASLLSGTNIFERNKPQYESYSSSQILSAKANGCAGE